MKKLFFVFFTLVYISCNDGEFIVEELNFNEEGVVTSLCGEHVFYKLINDNTEALIIQLASTTSIQDDPGIVSIPLNGSTNRVLYRVFDGDAKDFFCKEVQPASPKVIEEWTASGGTVEINTILEKDDNDGIPAEEEGYNAENPEDSQDTDEDGLPDYLDLDDDGDNVPTINEGYNIDDPENSLDTDKDGVRDYLDDDDDGDEIDTKDEDTNGDGNPRNDITDGYQRANYLEAEITIENPSTQTIEHSYSQTYVSEISIINGFQLIGNGQEIKYDVESFDYGAYRGASQSIPHEF